MCQIDLIFVLHDEDILVDPTPQDFLYSVLKCLGVDNKCFLTRPTQGFAYFCCERIESQAGGATSIPIVATTAMREPVSHTAAKRTTANASQ